jgi:endonuclease/exonuclease/phosphatase family metal-dependent hydrolase
MPVETILVWNLGFNTKTNNAAGISRRRLLRHLVADLAPSIVALQEAPSHLRLPALEREAGPGTLMTAFNSAVWQKTERTEFARRAVALAFVHRRTGRELLLCNVHLPSVLNGNVTTNQRAYVRDQFRPFLEAVRKPGRPEILVGDFNLPPYDEALTAPGGFWANRSWHDAAEYSRAAVAPKVPLFNASWVLLGNHQAPCGTYYLPQRLDGEGPWHVIDQALMSPELAAPGKDHVRLISAVRTSNLCSTRPVRTPLSDVGSDHLPFQVTLTL